MNYQRRNKYSQNCELEELISDINSLLSPSEKKILKQFKNPKFPVLLIVGCPRSGTTLLLQWLAATGLFAYPTNFLSRFYQAPYIGAKIQQMLFNPEYAFKNEMSNFANNNSIDFKSDLGKTRGALSPNEFWYFWRRFFQWGEIQKLDEEKIDPDKMNIFVSELTALESVLHKPLALKALIMNWNISFLSKVLENAIFLYIRRDPFFNIQSLLQARIKFYHSISHWYSFKPPEYEWLKDHSPYHQIAGQVYYTNKSIKTSLNRLARIRWLEIKYEDFCSKPEKVWKRLTNKLSNYETHITNKYQGPDGFQKTNKIMVSDSDINQIIAAYHDLFGIDILPNKEKKSGKSKETAHELHISNVF